MTERVRAEEAVKHQALHDALTDLPNRFLLEDRLKQAVLTARRERTPVALLFMDLDRFKAVNDTLGHQYGDLVLLEVGERMREVLRESDTVARIGGDEFAVVLPRADEQGALRAARKILEVLARPCLLRGRRFDIGASIGIALYPDHTETTDELLRCADVAMYTAKRAKSGCAVYRPSFEAAELQPTIPADLLR
jgi:diguanylate cyclase (GGDEF)-like protein